MTKEEIANAVYNLKKIRKQFNAYQYTHSIDLAIKALETIDMITFNVYALNELLKDEEDDSNG